MRRIWKSLGLAHVSAILIATQASAATLHDYRGTIGKLKIGLTIVAANEAMGKPLAEDAIINVHYFYVSKLIDIPLKLISFSGRDISFAENDANGKLIATFKLNFPTRDPNHHFVSADDLRNEVLIGTWISASGQSLDVYLKSESDVIGDDQGGRCDLSAENYSKLQDRVRLFYRAAMKNDTATLQKKFKIKIPKQASWHKELASSVPHDLFCNGQGFMLGRGIVWFNPDGSVARINKF